jgi:hypothetical protein
MQQDCSCFQMGKVEIDEIKHESTQGNKQYILSQRFLYFDFRDFIIVIPGFCHLLPEKFNITKHLAS